MKKLRIGFIGSGGMANAHLKGLADENQFPDVHLAAFCDIALERAQAQCDKYPAHQPTAYASPQTMIQEAGLDACYVLLPPFAHGDAEHACIAGRVPFLTEKPIGLDLGLLRELRDEVQGQNLLAAAGYMNRYQPSVQRAKAALGDDELVLAYGWWLSGPPRQPKDGKGSFLMQWWADKARSGGTVSRASHAYGRSGALLSRRCRRSLRARDDRFQSQIARSGRGLQYRRRLDRQCQVQKWRDCFDDGFGGDAGRRADHPGYLRHKQRS